VKEKAAAVLRAFDLGKFIKFGCVGVLNTLVDFAVFYVLDRWVIGSGPRLAVFGAVVMAGPYLSNAAAYAAANVNSFIWNRRWTFRKRERVTGREVKRYLLTSAGYLLLSSLSLAVCMGVLAGRVAEAWVNPLAKLPTACVTMFYNYLMNKFWVFRA